MLTSFQKCATVYSYNSLIPKGYEAMFTFNTRRAIQLRRELSAKLNRTVTRTEVAHEVSARLIKIGDKPVGLQVILRMEMCKPQRIDIATLNAFASFYRSHGLDVSTLVRYIEDEEEEPNDKNIVPHYADA